MDIDQLIELQEKYAACPVCKSNRTADGEMASMNNRFQRACKCGYAVEVIVTNEGILETGMILKPLNHAISSILENQTILN